MKTLFVWESVGDLTENYHDGGGVLVIADNLELARELLAKSVPSGCDAFRQPPDFTASVAKETEDKVTVFPDAGCC